MVIRRFSWSFLLNSHFTICCCCYFLRGLSDSAVTYTLFPGFLTYLEVCRMVVARESGVWVKVVDPNNLLVYTATELKRTVFQWTENPGFFA